MTIKHPNLYLQLCFRSGTEEQYNELKRLMDDAASFISDYKQEKAEKSKSKKVKEEQDKRLGLKMRDAALEALKRS